ncbi:MAG: hypothetical protein IJY93_08890 [Clostridia bacterium]|nr:hypothetical protein [Clostridia bacterium]
MTEYQNIIGIVAGVKPSMKWDGKESVSDWQARAKAKLRELIGLDKMIVAEKCLEIEYDRQETDFREIRFKFQSEPGYFVPCHMLIPNGVSGKLPAIICMQGHSKGMHISLGRTKYEDEEVNGDRDFCIRAVKEGYIAIALEQRNFGECGGTETGPKCTEPALTNLLIGRTTVGERVWDVSRCIDVLLSDFAEYVLSDQIYALGNSGGGTTTVYVTALEERLAGGVPSCAVSTFAASIGAMHHCACNYVPNILNYFDMAEILMMSAPRKLVVVSGAEDPIFPVKEAKEMVAEAKEFYTAAGAPERIAHVIGDGGHRFYADGAWSALKAMK